MGKDEKTISDDKGSIKKTPKPVQTHIPTLNVWVKLMVPELPPRAIQFLLAFKGTRVANEVEVKICNDSSLSFSLITQSVHHYLTDIIAC